MDVWAVHGLLGVFAVFIIFPLGILKRRTRITSSWLSHSFIQCVGLAFSLVGAGIGLFQSRTFHDVHQSSGIILVLVLYSQLLVGLIVRDIHKDSGARLYLQMYHIISGCTSLGLGWFTAMTGLLLASWSSNAVIIIALLTAMEVAAIPVICWYTRNKFAYLPMTSIPEIRISGEDDESSNADGRDKELGTFDTRH